MKAITETNQNTMMNSVMVSKLSIFKHKNVRWINIKPIWSDPEGSFGSGDDDLYNEAATEDSEGWNPSDVSFLIVSLKQEKQ